MNRKIVSAAIAVAAFAGAAHAQGPIEQAEPFNSVRSRAEVQADLQQYKKAGINHASTWYNPLREFKSVRTREAATAEYIAARDEVAAQNAEVVGAVPVATRTRLRDTLAGQPVNAQ